MDNKVVTNWINWQDWKQVVDNAYSKDIEANKKALFCITAWESRDANMQSALVCLKELLLAKLCQIDKQKASIEQLQIYQYNLSMNIIRFVNFITEPYQKSLFAKAIKTIANELGIPDWIVNLRHNATHFALPSIEILEEARDFLFKWLKERYVDTYKEYTLEASVIDSVKSEIKKIFSVYLDKKHIKKIKNLKKKKNQKHLIEVTQKLDDRIDIFIANFKTQTFEVLLNDGILIPTKDQLKSFGIIAEEFLEQESIDIPTPFLDIWELFLDYCAKNNLIGFLFDYLVQSYKNKHTDFNRDSLQSNLRNRFLLGWILCLIKLSASRGKPYDFDFNLKEVLLGILKSNPNLFSYLFLKEILQISSIKNQLNSNKLEKLVKLVQFACLNDNTVNILANNNQENSKEYMKSIYEYAPLRLQINENTKSHINNFLRNLKNESVWKLIDNDEWNQENLQLGLIDGQTYTSVNIDLGKYFRSINKDKLDNDDEYENIPPIAERNRKRKNTSNLLSNESLEQLKKSVFNNYWKVSS